MATAQDITAGGGGQAVPVSGGGAVLIKNGAGRLQKVLVTTVLTGTTWTFYDTTSLSNQTPATIVGIIISGTVAGQLFTFNMPVALGIVGVPSGGSAGSLTVSFN